jgi:hypothetical protein
MKSHRESRVCCTLNFAASGCDGRLHRHIPTNWSHSCLAWPAVTCANRRRSEGASASREEMPGLKRAHDQETYQDWTVEWAGLASWIWFLSSTPYHLVLDACPSLPVFPIFLLNTRESRKREVRLSSPALSGCGALIAYRDIKPPAPPRHLFTRVNKLKLIGRASSLRGCFISLSTPSSARDVPSATISSPS